MYEREVFASLLLYLYFTLFEKYWLFLCLAFYTCIYSDWCIPSELSVMHPSFQAT